MKIPPHAEAVIIGGGIMGCGLAYHLPKEGMQDVVLLEKAELTSGSTWHAAGQITHSTSSYSLGKCIGYNIDLYSRILEEETGMQVSWHGCGSLRLAYTNDEVDWQLQSMSVGKGLGFQMELLGPMEIANLHPFYNLDGIKSALHTPGDGHVDPSNVTHALAKGAKMQGVKIFRRTLVTGINKLSNGEWVVATPKGKITCKHVINAGGTYAKQIAEWSGYNLPATSMSHHYFVTDQVPEFKALNTELPVIRDDREISGYFRMEQKAGLIGIYEKSNPNPVWRDGCPWEAENELFEPDYDRIFPWLENAFNRVPILANLGIRRVVHGAISHPPDGNPLIGPAPRLENYWCCCGTQIGIGWGPALTRELARLIVHGESEINMREFDPRRFGSYASNNYQVVKAKEDYILRHEVPFPNYNRLDARPVRPSVIYDLLRDNNAVFEEVYGHERPRWFAPNNLPPRDIYSFRRSQLHEIIANEVNAVQKRAGLMDISAFTKVELSGKKSKEFLARLIPNQLPEPGKMRLTHLLNKAGRIELETTVFCLEKNRFYLVCAAFFEQRILDILHFSRGVAQVTIHNLSDEWGALAINGPASRKILSEVTNSPLSNSIFPWLSIREIEISGARLWAFRMSYAGELGWELHGPRQAIRDSFKSILAMGPSNGLRLYGSFAMNSMRLEKGYLGASELTNEVTLAETGQMRFVDQNHNFVGDQATFNSTPRFQCVQLAIEDNGNTDGNGGEAIYSSGKRIGSISSIGFGHRVNKLLAFGFVNPDYATKESRVEVRIMNELRKATVLTNPPYDQQNALQKM